MSRTPIIFVYCLSVLLIGSISSQASAQRPEATVRKIPRAERPALPAHIQRGTRQVQGKSISMTLNKAPIRSVLHVLFRRFNESYVFGPYVYGTVTATFHNLPFSRALALLLTSNSEPLTSTRVHGVYVIKSKKVIHPNFRGFRGKRRFFHPR